MKNKIIMLITAAVLACALTACTQADSNSNAASGAASSAEQSQSVSGGLDASGSGEVSGSGTSAEGSGAGAAGENTAEGAGGSQDTVSYETETTQDDAQVSSENEANYTDDEFDALQEESAGMDDGWTGTYISENDETLTVSVVDAATISFAFANAGISGNAELDGAQAIYHGDDYHVIVFDYAGEYIQVSVLSEEDYDTSASPLNGVYVRQ